jgi:hypothetical protein
MKRLLTAFVIMAMLAVCAPSNGYILVYKLSTTVKSVDTDANSITNVRVRGYLALDINDVTETVSATNSRMLIYGKDADANNVYWVEDFSGSPRVTWTEEGEYLTIEIVNHLDPFYYDLRFTGKIRERDVGFGNDDNNLRSAPSSFKGSMISTSGMIFDQRQTLFGSGSASMSLDIRKTKAANSTPQTIDDIMTEIVSGDGGLVEKGYESVHFIT